MRLKTFSYRRNQMKKTKYLFLLSLILFTPQLFADRTLNGNWINITFISDQTKTFFYYLETEGRFYYNSPTRDEVLMRPALGYTVNRKLSLWLGYAFFQSLEDSARRRQEIWEQLQFKIINSKPVDIISRTRLEERFHMIEKGTSVSIRQRQTITFNQAINEIVSPIIYDEIFLNLNHPEWVSRKTLSQNRFFLGAQISFNPAIAFIVGYLNRINYNSEDTIKEHLLHTSLVVTFG